MRLQQTCWASVDLNPGWSINAILCVPSLRPDSWTQTIQARVFVSSTRVLAKGHTRDSPRRQGKPHHKDWGESHIRNLLCLWSCGAIIQGMWLRERASVILMSPVGCLQKQMHSGAPTPRSGSAEPYQWSSLRSTHNTLGLFKPRLYNT